MVETTRAGELTERVAFEKRASVDDGLGNDVGDFEESFQVDAKVRARFGGETVMAARLEGRQPVTITVRNSQATREINTDWRARDTRAGTLYNIRSISDPDGGRQWLELLCEYGVVT